jgi:hypothetical protein
MSNTNALPDMGTTPGPTAYLATKVKGDRSMPSKQEMVEGVYAIVPQGPRDMVKAELPESQFPGLQSSSPRSQRLYKRGHRHTLVMYSPAEPFGRRTVGNDPTQGNGRDTYVALSRLANEECGIAYGTRVLWRRSPRSSPRTGKPSTWRRGAGVVTAEPRGTRDA